MRVMVGQCAGGHSVEETFEVESWRGCSKEREIAMKAFTPGV